MIQPQPLNPQLFNLLNAQPGGAIISSPGVLFEYTTKEEDGKVKLVPRVTGEYYVLYCPLCGYKKNRTLYINHAWRSRLVDNHNNELKDGQTDMLAICFHCNAEKQFEQLDGIGRKRVNKIVKYFSGAKVQKLKDMAHRATKQHVHVPVPPIILLRDLPQDHRARQYLLHRKGHPVDPDYVSDVHGIGYSHLFPYGDEENDPVLRAHQRAYDRLIIPIVKDDKIVHWQARAVDDDDPRGRWYFPPGQKPFPFRNWDTAARYRGVIIVEGYFDEVAAGPSGLTIFTKDMNFVKAKMIADQWEYVIIALDLKETQLTVTDKDGQQRMGSCHVIKERLIAAGVMNPPHVFQYPDDATGKDPSAMGPAAFWSALTSQLRKEYLDAISTPVRE